MWLSWLKRQFVALETDGPSSTPNPVHFAVFTHHFLPMAENIIMIMVICRAKKVVFGMKQI